MSVRPGAPGPARADAVTANVGRGYAETAVPAVALVDARKRFGATEALRGVSLSIPRGEAFALVGPDGAGKTTALKLVCGLLLPDSGSAGIFGLDPRSDGAKARLGYLSQRFSLYGDLSVEENLDFFAAIHGISGHESRKDGLLDAVGLSDFRGRQAARLSGGMKQKLALACSLVHEPELLVLDEPTTGVDPVARREFWTILARLIGGGMTVLVATPYMDEAERCARVGLIRSGRFLAVDSPKGLKDAIGARVVEISCDDARAVACALRAASSARGPASGGGAERPWNAVQVFGDRVDLLSTEPDAALAAAGRLLGLAGISPRSVRISEPSLENVFMTLAVDDKGGRV